MKDGRITNLSALIFVLVGSVLWCAAGTCTGVLSFRYASSTGAEKPAVEQETKEQYITSAHSMAGGIWAICGVGTGILILLSYTNRQKEDYFTQPPSSAGRILLKFVRPKTLAEAKTVPLASLMSVLGGVLLPILVLPKLATSETVIIRTPAVRIFAGLATTGFATMFILPLSLWLMTIIVANCKYIRDNLYSNRQIVALYFTKGEWFVPVFPLDKIKSKRRVDPVEVVCQLLLWAIICLSVYYYVTMGAQACCFTLVIGWIIFVTVFKSLTILAGPATPQTFNEQKEQEYLALRKATTRISSWAKTHFAQGNILEKGNQLRKVKSVGEVLQILENRVSPTSKYSSIKEGDPKKLQLAILYLQLGFLYRMINNLDKAENRLKDGVKILDKLHIESSCNADYANNLVIGLFRLAELSEVFGNSGEARNKYEESLRVAGSLGDKPTVEMIKGQIRRALAKVL